VPVILRGQRYYRTTEVCRLVGISRSTLLRWLSNGAVDNAPRRDRRDWRLFTEADIKKIETEATTLR
jgi:excisionase family DNA binding protein